MTTPVEQMGGAGIRLPRLTLPVILRIALCGAFVVVCYQFEWQTLRTVTTECILDMSAWLGVGLSRLSFDTVSLNGTPFQFIVACTQIDVFFGAIPLVWDLGRSIWCNLATLAIFFSCLSAFNLFRLELGFLLHSKGVSWFWAHEFIGGIALFAIFLWVVGQVKANDARAEQRIRRESEQAQHDRACEPQPQQAPVSN